MIGRVMISSTAGGLAGGSSELGAVAGASGSGSGTSSLSGESFELPEIQK